MPPLHMYGDALVILREAALGRPKDLVFLVSCLSTLVSVLVVSCLSTLVSVLVVSCLSTLVSVLVVSCLSFLVSP